MAGQGGDDEKKNNNKSELVISMEMTVDELLSQTKCEMYRKHFEIFDRAADILQYDKDEFKTFLTINCGMIKFSDQFVKMGNLYDKLKEHKESIRVQGVQDGKRQVTIEKGELKVPFTFYVMFGNGLETFELAKKKHESFKHLTFFDSNENELHSNGEWAEYVNDGDIVYANIPNNVYAMDIYKGEAEQPKLDKDKDGCIKKCFFYLSEFVAPVQCVNLLARYLYSFKFFLRVYLLVMLIVFLLVQDCVATVWSAAGLLFNVYKTYCKTEDNSVRLPNELEKKLLRMRGDGVSKHQSTPQLCARLLGEKFGGFVILFLFPIIGVIVGGVMANSCKNDNLQFFCFDILPKIYFINFTFVIVDFTFVLFGYFIFLIIYYCCDLYCADAIFDLKSRALSKDQKCARKVGMNDPIQIKQ